MVSELERRRAAAGMPVSALAERAGVDRGRLAKVLRGEVNARSTFLGAVDSALTRWEEEVGDDDPESPDFIEFTVSDERGLRIVAKAPVRDAEALKRQVVDIVREIRKGDTRKRP